MLSNLPPGVTDSMLEGDLDWEKAVDWYNEDSNDIERIVELKADYPTFDDLPDDLQNDILNDYKEATAVDYDEYEPELEED